MRRLLAAAWPRPNSATISVLRDRRFVYSRAWAPAGPFQLLLKDLLRDLVHSIQGGPAAAFLVGEFTKLAARHGNAVLLRERLQSLIEAESLQFH